MMGSSLEGCVLDDVQRRQCAVVCVHVCMCVCVCLYERESERESVCACVCVRVTWVFVSLEGCAIDDAQWYQCAVGIYTYSCSVYKEVARRYVLSQECALMTEKETAVCLIKAHSCDKM